MFVIDEAESELAVLDLIQVLVEVLDKSFENVCELDLIFHPDKINYILDEIIVDGKCTSCAPYTKVSDDHLRCENNCTPL